MQDDTNRKKLIDWISYMKYVVDDSPWHTGLLRDPAENQTMLNIQPIWVFLFVSACVAPVLPYLTYFVASIPRESGRKPSFVDSLCLWYSYAILLFWFKSTLRIYRTLDEELKYRVQGEIKIPFKYRRSRTLTMTILLDIDKLSF